MIYEFDDNEDTEAPEITRFHEPGLLSLEQAMQVVSDEGFEIRHNNQGGDNGFAQRHPDYHVVEISVYPEQVEHEQPAEELPLAA